MTARPQRLLMLAALTAVLSMTAGVEVEWWRGSAAADPQRVDGKVRLDEDTVAPVNEFAYGLEGELAVVARRRGKNVVDKGGIEFAPAGVSHLSLNESRRPAWVLVVLLKER